MSVHTHLYAAKLKTRVLAFEPSPGNYYLLMRNIEVNEAQDLISSYCIAFCDETRLAEFHMSNTQLGAAYSSFGEALDPLGSEFIASYRQAMVGYTIDEFVARFAPPFPNHLKIDVDGIEEEVIDGARETLSDERVRSVLVELDESRKGYSKTVEILQAAGLHIRAKAHPPEFDNSAFANQYNFIFSRE